MARAAIVLIARIVRKFFCGYFHKDDQK